MDATELGPSLLSFCVLASFSPIWAKFSGAGGAGQRSPEWVGLQSALLPLLLIFQKGRKGRKGRKVYVASAQLYCDHFGCLRPLDSNIVSRTV